MQRRTQHAGFTLIEVMMVVLIVAILAAIAFPSYENFMRRARLENARTDLMSNAQMLERYYSQCHTFTGNAGATAPCTTTMALNNTGISNRFFNINYAAGNPTADSFIIEARPNGSSNETRFLRYDSTAVMLLCEGSPGSEVCQPY